MPPFRTWLHITPALKTPKLAQPGKSSTLSASYFQSLSYLVQEGIFSQIQSNLITDIQTDSRALFFKTFTNCLENVAPTSQVPRLDAIHLIGERRSSNLCCDFNRALSGKCSAQSNESNNLLLPFKSSVSFCGHH